VAQDVKKVAGQDYSIHRLLLGTHTAEGEQNYLMVADVRLPMSSAEVDGSKYDDTDRKCSMKTGISFHFGSPLFIFFFPSLLDFFESVLGG